MAHSYTNYTVDSGTATSKTFSIGFDFLRSSHITTTVAGSANTDFTVNVSAGTITFGGSTTLTIGQAVVITRTTPKTKSTRVVDFADGSILSETSLDDSALQLLYISQEAFDQSADTLSKDASDGQWDAGLLRIKDLAPPTDQFDAARKLDVDNAVTDAGNLPGVTSSDNDSGLFVSSGSWATRTPAQSRTHLGLGTSSTVDTGTGTGNIPLLDAVGYPTTISGAQIPNVLAEGLSVALFQWTAMSGLQETTDANWATSTTRIPASAHAFINNGPTTGGDYFTIPSTSSDGLDIAAGKYLVFASVISFDGSFTGSPLLKLRLGTTDLNMSTGAGSTHQQVENGLVIKQADSSTGAAYYVTHSVQAYIIAGSASSIALFGCNADTTGDGTIHTKGVQTNAVQCFVIRVSD